MIKKVCFRVKMALKTYFDNYQNITKFGMRIIYLGIGVSLYLLTVLLISGIRPSLDNIDYSLSVNVTSIFSNILTPLLSIGSTLLVFAALRKEIGDTRDNSIEIEKRKYNDLFFKQLDIFLNFRSNLREKFDTQIKTGSDIFSHMVDSINKIHVYILSYGERGLVGGEKLDLLTFIDENYGLEEKTKFKVLIQDLSYTSDRPGYMNTIFSCIILDKHYTMLSNYIQQIRAITELNKKTEIKDSKVDYLHIFSLYLTQAEKDIILLDDKRASSLGDDNINEIKKHIELSAMMKSIFEPTFR